MLHITHPERDNIQVNEINEGSEKNDKTKYPKGFICLNFLLVALENIADIKRRVRAMGSSARWILGHAHLLPSSG